MTPLPGFLGSISQTAISSATPITALLVTQIAKASLTDEDNYKAVPVALLHSVIHRASGQSSVDLISANGHAGFAACSRHSEGAIGSEMEF